MSLFSENLSRLAARKYARIIQKLGFPVSDNYTFHHLFMLTMYIPSQCPLVFDQFVPIKHQMNR